MPGCETGELLVAPSSTPDHGRGSTGEAGQPRIPSLVIVAQGSCILMGYDDAMPLGMRAH
jgi:hypothetical protein